jgi:hypothetical protein
VQLFNANLVGGSTDIITALHFVEAEALHERKRRSNGDIAEPTPRSTDQYMFSEIGAEGRPACAPLNLANCERRLAKLELS